MALPHRNEAQGENKSQNSRRVASDDNKTSRSWADPRHPEAVQEESVRREKLVGENHEFDRRVSLVVASAS